MGHCTSCSAQRIGIQMDARAFPMNVHMLSEFEMQATCISRLDCGCTWSTQPASACKDAHGLALAASSVLAAELYSTFHSCEQCRTASASAALCRGTDAVSLASQQPDLTTCVPTDSWLRDPAGLEDLPHGPGMLSDSQCRGPSTWKARPPCSLQTCPRGAYNGHDIDAFGIGQPVHRFHLSVCQ